jgi:hypothetical protein
VGGNILKLFIIYIYLYNLFCGYLMFVFALIDECKCLVYRHFVTQPLGILDTWERKINFDDDIWITHLETEF